MKEGHEMNNIVIFGPTQVGKTTLAGYLVSRQYSSFGFDHEAKKFKRLINDMGIPYFKADLILNCFVSIDRDEILRNVNSSSIGTTKRIHRKNIYFPDNRSYVETLLIDTPGTRSKVSVKYRGLFEGETGIYVLSLPDIENWLDAKQRNADNERSITNRLFEPLRIWCAYKSAKQLLIVLSKADRLGFDLERIDRAVQGVIEEFRKISGMDAQPIPIGITVEYSNDRYQRHEYNVSKPYDGFGGKYASLDQELIQLFMPTQSLPYRDGIASIDRLAKIRNSTQHALRVKVIDGSLKKGMTVFFGPVENRSICDEPFIATGRIKSLKEEEGDKVEALSTDGIGGVILENLGIEQGGRLHCGIECLKYKKTSIISEQLPHIGNCLQVEIPIDSLSADEYEQIDSLFPKEQITIIWLGRRIMLDLCEKYKDDNSFHLTLAALSKSVLTNIGFFALPYKETDEVREASQILILLRKPKSIINNGKVQRISEVMYFNACVKQVMDLPENISSMCFQFDTEEELILELCDELSALPEYKLSKRGEFVISGIKSDTLGSVLRAVRRMFKNQAIHVMSIRINAHNYK